MKLHEFVVVTAAEKSELVELGTCMDAHVCGLTFALQMCVLINYLDLRIGPVEGFSCRRGSVKESTLQLEIDVVVDLRDNLLELRLFILPMPSLGIQLGCQGFDLGPGSLKLSEDFLKIRIRGRHGGGSKRKEEGKEGLR